MVSQARGHIDPEMINLSGGLFERSHVTAPIESIPDRVTPLPAVVVGTVARARVRRARTASWTVMVATMVTVGAGLAAAGQMPRGPATTPRDARITDAPAILAALPAPAIVSTPAAPAPEPEAVEPEPIASPTAEPLPLPSAATGHAEPRAPAPMVLPPRDPSVSLLDALAVQPADFDRAAAAIAIATAARGAGRCVDAGDTRTTTSARVTFAPSGRVIAATMDGGPFLATEAGNCIAGALRGAKVGPFQGGPVTVRTTIRLR